MKEISNYEKNNSNESNSKGFTNKQISYVFYYLFNKLGVHFGNSDKTQWARFISKLIGRNEQNIREIITGFDLERKSDQKDLRVVSSLFNELFPKIVEDIENDIK